MRNELVERVFAFTEKRGGASAAYSTGLPWLTVMRSALKTPANQMLYRPSLCVVLQGSKEMCIGDERLAYRAMEGLIVRVSMPAAGRIADASANAPFLGLMVELDVALMRQIANEMTLAPVVSDDGGAFVVPIEGAVEGAMARMVGMLEDPAALNVLGASWLRELSFHLLRSDYGAKVQAIALADGRTQGLAAAITMLVQDPARPVRIPELARAANMSLTAFHDQFKSVTSLTPLQYQKRLRLLEARRLLLDDATTAESAAFRVGYQSASQFSREYTRMFGAPPRRDTQRMVRGR